ncbi:2-polyprenyl-3-methyl-5-hydroxy-6-metoxy-1,4-benzoquinol methylase [Arcicella aurantiaca]|uniref:2-polyprenyl-3-methyl-5-hydroxy-6-metoxy-1, 4-benzoquinol methylase n=1 Tax=Arcicella aurantiaca TaxID=591202 RepID=A0A316DJN4_9BACT|nr:class I SAM-dependent methyltransferase [Arcicella aurantiaca]PWK17848.1 2-polyprenyl-3-methyl-5-hydroxy-6-metoxy-1,4-benzoquinol methylase [Arcicella aurantiaca]
MEELKNCPVCQNNTFVEFLKVQDFTVSQEKFSIQECKSCGFKFTNPRPEIAKIGDYYKAESYISHTNTSKGLISKLYHSVRKYTLKGKLNLINSLIPQKGKLLDVGCGTGMFLNVCREDGWKVNGIEPDNGARQIAEEINKATIKTEILSSFQNETFDIITMWHVLEHVHLLNETVDWLKERLSDKGYLIIAVPNHESKDAEIYQEHWAAYDVPRHLYHFSQKSIKQLFEQKGFSLKETLPMKFDSFYVSMLSTKYQSGSINYIKAFIDGLKSNLNAGGNHGNYSSLIYIFKKD